MPTTHILKSPTGAFDGHAENENFCLALARALGLPVASSTVAYFGDEIAFVVERYDRRVTVIVGRFFQCGVAEFPLRWCGRSRANFSSLSRPPYSATIVPLIAAFLDAILRQNKRRLVKSEHYGSRSVCG
jgi:hypothetical protein